MKITDEQLSAYLDGALSSEERAMVDRALAESPELQRELARLRQLGPLLKEVPTPEPSERFYRRVLEKTKPQPSPWIQWVFPLVGAAAAALVMVYIAGEKKDSFRQSITSKPALVPMKSEPLEARTKSMDSSGFEDEERREPTRGAVSAGNIEKLKNGVAQENVSLQAQAARKKIAPTSALPAAAGRSISSLIKEGKDLTLDSLETKTRSDGLKADKMSLTVRGEGAIGGATNLSSRSQLLEPVSAKAVTDSGRISGKEFTQKPAAPAMPSALREEARLPMEWQGDSSGITDHREVVIKDAATWAKLWAEHQSNLGITPTAPSVNFNKSMIVGIFLGDRGSSGYTARITKIEEVGKELVVSYRETQPSSGGMQLTVMTQPYHLIAIPRTTRPILFKKE